MKIKRAKLKIAYFLICALLFCSFPSVKSFAETNNAYVGIICRNLNDDSTIEGHGFISSIYENINSSGYTYSFSFDLSTISGFSYVGYSLLDYDNFSWSSSFSGSVIEFSLFSENVLNLDGEEYGPQAVLVLTFVPETLNPNPTPTDTPTPTPTATPTPWVEKYFGSGNITSYLYFFNGNYPSNSDTSTWFDPAGQIFSKIIIRVSDNTSFTGDIELPFPYILNKSRYPVLVNRTAEGYNNKGYQGTFSVGNEDGTILHVDGFARPGYSGQSSDLFISVITVTPTPTLSPTPTLTPYPSSAPASFSTYTVNFVAPNGYIVGSIPFLFSVGSSYAGAISNLTFSFLDGWFSYGDEVNGEKGSFIWEYSYSENFKTYLWHFSTTSWPVSESINIPVYRLDGEYPEVVPDLNNVSDLFDTIGKTDPSNFSWFYDGLQAFIDINWSWAYLMLLFPLFVMLWAFFRRH